jgi:hypothetical protein
LNLALRCAACLSKRIVYRGNFFVCVWYFPINGTFVRLLFTKKQLWELQEKVWLSYQLSRPSLTNEWHFADGYEFEGYPSII